MNCGILLSRTSVCIVYMITKTTSLLHITGKWKGLWLCTLSVYNVCIWDTECSCYFRMRQPKHCQDLQGAHLIQSEMWCHWLQQRILQGLCVLPKIHWCSPYMEASALPEQASFLLIRECVITKVTCNDIYEMWILDLFCTHRLIFLSKVACYANSEDCKISHDIQKPELS